MKKHNSDADDGEKKLKRRKTKESCVLCTETQNDLYDCLFGVLLIFIGSYLIATNQLLSASKKLRKNLSSGWKTNDILGDSKKYSPEMTDVILKSN